FHVTGVQTCALPICLALTPIALAEGQIVARRLFGKQTPGELNYDLVATAVFSQPPISTVGMDEETARKTLGDVDVYRSRFTPLRSEERRVGKDCRCR